MNKQSPEYERVRTEAVERTKNILDLPSDEYSLSQSANKIVDYILSLVEIRADDQYLPITMMMSLREAENVRIARQDMLKEGWLKVVKEE